VVVAPHGLDVEAFSCACEAFRQDRAASRAAWGIEERAVVFLFAGKLEQKKRPHDFLRAFATLARERRGLPTHCLVVGDGELRGSLEPEARAISPRVTFAGFLNQGEIPRAYAVSDVLVLPSDGRETWGLVVNEAMACGLPVIISSEVGAGPDLVESRGSGLIYPMGDVGALSTALARTLDEGARRNMGARAQAISREFSAEVAARRVADALLAAAPVR
jgi:glycosyltransferase involved in cell wall biosynthesis